MTTKETEMILELLRTEYPHSFERLEENQRAVKVKTWTATFAEYDKEEVLRAVKAFMDNDTKGFAPVSGQIKQYLNAKALPEADELTIAIRGNLEVYKAVTGEDYVPSDCVKEELGFPKCSGCNEETKCRPAKERSLW